MIYQVMRILFVAVTHDSHYELGILAGKLTCCQDYGEETEGLNVVQEYVKSH